MKEFIIILLFSKILLLTNSPVELGLTWLEITPKSPLKAITSGASLQIDISALAKGVKDFKELQMMFPSGTIEAKLVSTSGEEILLRDGSFAYSGESVRIILYGVNPIPTGKEFVKLVIRSSIVIRNVDLYWKNYKH